MAEQYDWMRDKMERDLREFERAQSDAARRAKLRTMRRRIPIRHRRPPTPTPIPASSAGGASRVLSAARAIFGRLGAVVAGADVLARIADEISQQRLEETLRGQQNVVEQKLASRAVERELRTVFVNEGTKLSEPDVIPRPAPQPEIAAQPSILSDPISPEVGEVVFPSQTPAIEPGVIAAPGLPQPQVFPELDPDVFANPTPQPMPQPSPVWQPQPGNWPHGAPMPNPFAVPLPFSFPLPGTRAVPRGVPEVRRFRLTGSDPDAVALDDPRINPFTDPVPVPQPQTDPARRCKPCPKKKEKEERRTQCFKKFVEEREFERWDFVREWAEIDCTTGREL